MSHATHFLQRLERASTAQADLALQLYRDEKALGFIILAARLNLPDGGRAALSLDESNRGPFLVVSKEGKFITCLGRDMHTSDLPLIPFRTVMASLAEAKDYEKRVVLATAMAGGEQHVSELTTLLYSRADNLAREEFRAISVLQPFLKAHFLARYFSLANELRGPRKEILKIKQPTAAQIPMLKRFWESTWAMGHFLMLATMDGRRDLDEEIVDELAEGGFLGWPAFRQGELALSMRGAWAVGRFGKPLLPSAIRYFQSDVSPLGYTMGLTSLVILAQRYPNMNNKVRDLMNGPNPFNAEIVRLLNPVKDMFLAVYRAVLVDPEAVKEVLVHRARGLFMAVVENVKRSPVLPWTRAEDVPEDLALSCMANMRGDAMNNPAHYVDLLTATTWLAHAEAHELYLPAPYAEALASRWQPSDTLDLVRRWEKHNGKPKPVRAEPSVGRNAPCPCGSGKKYKHCCADKHAEA